jgi:CheY-like chemotaxis protein
MRILHIEDDADLAELYGFAMRELGHHEVTRVADGPNGLSAAMTGEFDLIVLDLGLPGMDGEELLLRLRQAVVRPEPVVVVLSCRENPNELQSLLASGADVCLAKHITGPQDLVDHLAMYGPAGAAADTGSTQPKAEPGDRAVSAEGAACHTRPASPSDPERDGAAAASPLSSTPWASIE